MFDGLRLAHWRADPRPDGILVLTLDRADQNVNALSRAVLDELESMVERIALELPKGVVIISGKAAGFIPGADIKGFEAIDSVSIFKKLPLGRVGESIEVARLAPRESTPAFSVSAPQPPIRTISPAPPVMLSLPPLTLMLPPMRPPETMMVSVPNPVTRLPRICPPDRSKILLSSFMSTRPMVPPVMRATSPSSKAATMVPPVIRNVSRPSPWARNPSEPPVMVKTSMPAP